VAPEKGVYATSDGAAHDPGGDPLSSPAAWDATLFATAAAIAAKGVDRAFLLHVGMLRCLTKLRAACAPEGSFVVMVSDKGFPSVEHVEADGRGASDPFLARHGSVSVSVSFHTLAHLFEAHLPGGYSVMPVLQPR
jgi:hypothetical protein